MRVIVTGALGFIGSRIVHACLDRGDEVIGIDNKSRPATQEDRRVRYITRNVAQALTNANPLLHSKAEPVELIFHTAAPVGAAAMKPETQTLWQIVRDAHAVFDFACRTGAKVVCFSSPEIYGWGNGDAFDEATHLEVHLPYNPRYEYPVGKLAMECMGFVHPHPFIQFLRPYNVCGPGQNPAGGFVLARFVDAVKNDKPITIFGDGTQRRQFIHVEDVVGFCMWLRPDPILDNAIPSGNPWDDKNIWNLATPDSIISIKDLAEMVVRIAGKGTIEYVDPRVALNNPHYVEAPEKFVDVSKALSTGWKPTRTLEEIVKEALG